LSRRHCVCGGARAGQFWSAAAARRQPKKIGGGRGAGGEVLAFAYLFRKFFNKELIIYCYQGVHVEQLFFAVVWSQILKKYIIKRGLQKQRLQNQAG